MKIEITYMSGAGNLFTVIDNRQYRFDREFCSKLSPVLTGINEFNKFKTEGLLVINTSESKDFETYFFNPDGTHEIMCGNGARCAIEFASSEGFFKKPLGTKIRFEMAGDIYSGIETGNSIRLFLPPPQKITEEIILDLKNFQVKSSYVNVNSDHAVINIKNIPGIDSIKDINIKELGPQIRYNKVFQDGANANFYNVESRERIIIRTYERGVEAETGACGTGAVSTAIIAAILDEIDLPVTLIPPSGKPLSVDIVGEIPYNVSWCILEGGAEKIETVIIEIPAN